MFLNMLNGFIIVHEIVYEDNGSLEWFYCVPEFVLEDAK